MLSTTDFKRGLKIEIDNTPYEIIESQHYKPGKGGAIVRTKLRNLLTSRVVDRTFRSGEKVKNPISKPGACSFCIVKAKITFSWT